MKPILRVAVLLVLLLAPAAWGEEVIRNFEVDITPVDPATLEVTEKIVMDFGDTERRGIFRNIPYRYERGGGPYTVKLVDIDVTDAEGRSRPAKIDRAGGVLSIRIGDPDIFVTGEHIYVLRYTARRAVNFFDEGQPEIYWNVTGNEWPFPIESVTARVNLPEGVAPADVRTDSFVGTAGANDRGRVEIVGDALVFTAEELLGSEGLTILARLPAGSVEQAGWGTAIGWWLSDWWPTLVLPLLGVGAMVSLWWVRGRDEGANDAVPVEWDPPADMTPAEVGILIDEVCHTHDVIATVIDLAVRGYLRIEHTSGDGSWTGLSKGSWTFIKLPHKLDTKRPLLPHEQDLLDGIFTGGAESVELDDLKGKFYEDFAAIRKDLYERMTERGFFAGNPEVVRNGYRSLGVFMLLGALIFGFLSLANEWALLPWALGVGLASLPVLILAGTLPARTLAGSKMLRECRGFRRFLVDVEKDRLAEAQEKDPTIFGRLLPFAMVLGVEDRWAEQFEGLLTQEPDWYSSGSKDGFAAGMFIGSFGRGVTAMGSSMTARPASSAAGGGSSGFSSGGGFSGGGFGGGGGGSW